MFSVYHSNQLDVLKSLLAELIRREPQADPFASELILVQSPGMAQWLKQALAGEFGVAARLEFPLPSSFIWRMFSEVLPDVPQQNPYTKSAMTWRLMQLLPSMFTDPLFAALKHYLEQDADGRKLYQLCQRIADVFDQYLVYRPDWIADWESGGALAANKHPWQPVLWRSLVCITEQQALHIHRANLFDAFIAQLGKLTSSSALPKRLFIFGITSLPPHYLQALSALGEHIDVHFMLTNPCRHYWGDLVDDWRMNQGWLQRLLSRRRTYLDSSLSCEGEARLVSDSATLARLFNPEGELTLGNPLLVSMGKQGRDHHSLLLDLQPNEFDVFVELEPHNLLTTLQSDILELRDRSHESDPLPLLEGDDSLLVHACHSPMREVEVLHDALLARFAADPALKPRDVIVMVADIDSYSPFVQAVFGSAPAERHIPFSISDRSMQQESPLLQSFLMLLHLPESRCSAPDLVTLLAVPEVLAAMGLEASDLPQVQRWINEAAIRWGLDGADAERFDLASMPATTWLDGIERMLLGFAMGEDQLFAGVLPYLAIEGQDAQRLGHLGAFLERLRTWRERLPQARTIGGWSELIDALLLEFYVADEDGELQLELIRQALQRLRDQLNAVAYDAPLTLAVLRDYLQGELTSQKSGQQFLAGRVNFCTLMPMRSIPFKLVCLLGMNDGVYPRSVPPLGFDLIAASPRRGDRSRREDDRYLFLEALTAAEQYLHISYVARCNQDNSSKEPSVLLAELIDYCQSAFVLPGSELSDESQRRKAVYDFIVRQHALTPYAERYFMVGSPESYASEWCDTQPRTSQRTAFFDAPLPLPHAFQEQADIELRDLMAFFRNPLAGFFNQVLRVRFDTQEASLPEDETFELDRLQAYLLKNELLEASLHEPDSGEALRQRLLHSGRLPFGAFGELTLNTLEADLAKLGEILRSKMSPTPAQQIIALPFPEIEFPEDMQPPPAGLMLRLLGSISGIHDGVMLRYRPGGFSAEKLLSCWIEHLAFCASHDGVASPSLLLGTDKQWQLLPIAQPLARAYLSELLAAYLYGLTQPLPLLLQSGWAWIQQAGEVREEDGRRFWVLSEEQDRLNKATAKMQEQFMGSDWRRGEIEDPYIRRIYHQWDPLMQEQIIRWSERLLTPLAAHLMEMSDE